MVFSTSEGDALVISPEKTLSSIITLCLSADGPSFSSMQPTDMAAAAMQRDVLMNMLNILRML